MQHTSILTTLIYFGDINLHRLRQESEEIRNFEPEADPLPSVLEF